jgi:hypothetical protein
MLYWCEDPHHCGKRKLMEFSNFLCALPFSGRRPNSRCSLPPFERLLARGSKIHAVSKSLPNQIIATAPGDHRLPGSISMPLPHSQTVIGAVEEVTLHRFSCERKVLAQSQTVNTFQPIP